MKRAKSRGNKKTAHRSLLLLALTLAVVLLAAIMPTVLLQMEEARLFAEPHYRTRLGGSLTGNHYLSWILHARGAAENMLVNDGKAMTAEQRNKAGQLALQKTKELARAGILAGELEEQLETRLFLSDTLSVNRQLDSFGFENIVCYSRAGEGYLSVGVQVESRTGKAVWYNINTDIPQIALLAGAVDDETLRLYREWLGFSEKEGWRPAGPETGVVLERENATTILLEQTSAYVSEDNGLYVMAASSLQNPLTLQTGLYDGTALYPWKIA